MTSAFCVVAVAVVCLCGGAAMAGIDTYTVESEYQNGQQQIDVLVPDHYDKAKKYPVLYVLPVGAGLPRNAGWYPLGILKDMDAHNRYQLIIVQMGFEKEPWFGDHATDPKVRQASYIKEFLVPFVENKYATLGTPEGRLLMGFSKSGWGAFSLILKYPDFFGYAAAWDAPLLLRDFKYAMKDVYGTPEQLALYRPDLLIPARKASFQKQTRLVLTGEKLWGKRAPATTKGHTVEAHELLEQNGIPHFYDDSIVVEHRWDKQWMEPTLKALMDLTHAPPTPTTQPAAR